MQIRWQRALLMLALAQMFYMHFSQRRKHLGNLLHSSHKDLLCRLSCISFSIIFEFDSEVFVYQDAHVHNLCTSHT